MLVLLIGCGDRIEYPIKIKSKSVCEIVNHKNKCYYTIEMFGKDPGIIAPCDWKNVGDIIQ
jgi:hypothetical protein